MWLELGKQRPGVVLQDPQPIIWINTDHIVRVEFIEEGALTATVTSTKPGGSDRTIFRGDDAERLRRALNKICDWQPLLDHELPEPKKSKTK